jgi:hypothetical protein
MDWTRHAWLLFATPMLLRLACLVSRVRAGLRTTVLLANVVAFTFGMVVNHLVAAEAGPVDPGKITGCWHVRVKGTATEAGRNFEITRVTETYRVEGQDAQGLELHGSFEPSPGGWFGYLGLLILQAPRPHFDGYGPDYPQVAKHPTFSLAPAEASFIIGPTMAPGLMRTFALFDSEVARGMTIGSAEYLYRCGPAALSAPAWLGPESLAPDPPSSP